MSGSAVRGMLDTSTVILLGSISDPDDLPDDSVVSAVTLAELSVGPHVARTSQERAARQAHLQQAEADFEAIPFDAAAARAFGRVAASLRRAGRKPSARAYDALIAATAIANGLPLYTCNPDDFASIDELTLHAVPHPNRH
jgi:tRNA(fMet)-specific endonuclease VapC